MLKSRSVDFKVGPISKFANIVKTGQIKNNLNKCLSSFFASIELIAIKNIMKDIRNRLFTFGYALSDCKTDNLSNIVDYLKFNHLRLKDENPIYMEDKKEIILTTP